MYDKTIQCIADTYSSCLRVKYNVGALLKIATGIKIRMHDASACFNHGHFRIVPHIVNQVLTAPWDNDVNITDGIQHLKRCCTVGGKQSDDVRCDVQISQYFLDEFYNEG